MSLFLPILLLGMVQPTDQPTVPPVAGSTTTQATAVESGGSLSLSPKSVFRMPLDPCDGDKACEARRAESCLTMRSYYFERRDDLAPELKGMTTCESMSQVRQRNARRKHAARLVPAN